MEPHAGSPAVERLEAFIGEWSIEADFPNAPPTDWPGPHRRVDTNLT
jgi:hypothetical protein